MARKQATVEEVFQRIDEDLKGDIQQYPTQIQRFFTSNVVLRRLAYLFGFTEEGKAVKLKATAEGKLKVAIAGAGYTYYEVKKGTATDDYTSENIYEFSEPYGVVDLLIEGNDAVISFKMENGQWGADITMTVGYHSLDFVANGIRIKNRTAGLNANYEIVLYR